MSVPGTIDYVATAKELMLSQFDDSPIAQSLLASWVDPLQSLEDDLQEYTSYNGITNAYGTVLDYIGEFMGVDRGTMLDSEYRQAILARGLLEGADGTTEKFLEGLRVLCNTDLATFHEYYPATAYAHAGEGYTVSTIQELRRIAPAGVHIRLLVDEDLESFQFSEILELSNQLHTGAGEGYIVEKDSEMYDLVVSQNSGEDLTEDGDLLAELFDTEFTPLADVITQKLSLKNNYAVDNNGNYLVDNDGNRFIFTDIG